MAFLPLLPPLHVGGPEPTGPLYTHWFLDPGVAIGVFGLAGLYLAIVGPLNRRLPDAEHRPVATRQIVMFLLGCLFALIALGPPMDDWSHFFLSSAHMLQHLILILISAPLWLAGLPGWVFAPLVKNPVTNAIFGRILSPVPAFLVAAMINVVWHTPAAYGAALDSELWHTAQHLMFVWAGVLMWWPLMSRVPAWPRLSPPLQAFWLFVQTIPTGLIGAFLTYAGPLYPHYGEASVRPWGIDTAEDQSIAGLLMWVGMNAVFLVLLTIIFLRWATREERDDRQRLLDARTARTASRQTHGDDVASPARS